MKKESFKQGITDGIPIALGYLAVSFTFGMMAVQGGLSIWQAVLISLTNLTSAGQFAGLDIIIAGGSLWEMALTHECTWSCHLWNVFGCHYSAIQEKQSSASGCSWSNGSERIICLGSCIIESLIRICDYYYYNSGSRTGSMALPG